MALTAAMAYLDGSTIPTPGLTGTMAPADTVTKAQKAATDAAGVAKTISISAAAGAAIKPKSKGTATK